MQLSPGLNLSILASYSLPRGHPLSKDHIFAVGIPNVDGGLFFPILSSPFFNDSSQAAPPGFAFGLYGSPCNSAVCTLYLAVCAGYSGNTEPDALQQSGLFFPLSTPAGIKVYPSYFTQNGIVVPLWIANGDSPINNAGDASLVVVAAQSGMELTSINSAYTARMEKGGLALFMNDMGGKLPPYWIFPFLRDPGGPLQSQREAAA
ncbi:hypothetical protein GOP47_0017115 [Adiantum capillus-veneris]|uniref:Uncharacterized protein n=1 Tax=Adiantum capillus-veneris TaxID=13818 RepID=A0A9D4ZCT1_ADICA|nr:hypothetical protein GOP47_0017115 [Adiantum capillus-veneris]